MTRQVVTHPDGTPGSGPGSALQQTYIQTVAAAELPGRVVIGLGEALGHAAGKQSSCSLLTHRHWSLGLTWSRSRIMMRAYTGQSSCPRVCTHGSVMLITGGRAPYWHSYLIRNIRNQSTNVSTHHLFPECARHACTMVKVRTHTWSIDHQDYEDYL